jgi:CRP-like cAMP-binding protein
LDNQLLRFRNFIQAQNSPDDHAWDLLRGILEYHSVKKSEFTLQDGQVCRFIDFVDKGSFRSFYNKDGDEVTTALYLEGVCVTNMVSLSKGEPSKLMIQANEDSLVVRLYKDRLINLYEQSAGLQSIGRAVLESMVIEENSWKEMYALYSSEERYQFLTTKSPTLPARFSLQHIASFLGIRRETLSRIRHRVK